MTFTRVAQASELWQGELRAVEAGGRKLLLVNLGDRIAAYVDRCPHLGVPLSRGTLEGDVLRCSGHDWEFDLRSGKGLNPARACLEEVPLRIDGEDVLVEVTS
jgi:toluene monooxygenase system ferredoxin subunit